MLVEDGVRDGLGGELDEEDAVQPPDDLGARTGTALVFGTGFGIGFVVERDDDAAWGGMKPEIFMVAGPRGQRGYFAWENKSMNCLVLLLVILSPYQNQNESAK